MLRIDRPSGLSARALMVHSICFEGAIRGMTETSPVYLGHD
jgi:hypothetical protein